MDDSCPTENPMLTLGCRLVQRFGHRKWPVLIADGYKKRMEKVEFLRQIEANGGGGGCIIAHFNLNPRPIKNATRYQSSANFNFHCEMGTKAIKVLQNHPN